MKIFTLSRQTRLGPAHLRLRRRTKILLSILLGLLFFQFVSSPTFAQGSCSCSPTGEFGGCESDDTCDSEYSPSEDSCPTDLSVGWGCEIGASCTCVADSVTPCTDAGGVCLDDCGVDYTSYPPGDVECAAGMCCQPAAGDGGPICTCTPPGGGCGIQTAIGCIPTDLDAFAGFILERGIYLGILVAILLIIISGYGIISSTGDPERLAEAKSRLTAAIAGLLFLLFSVIILRIIACNIIGGEAKVFFCP